LVQKEVECREKKVEWREKDVEKEVGKHKNKSEKNQMYKKKRLKQIRNTILQKLGD
jgi:hypothetical protein